MTIGLRGFLVAIVSLLFITSLPLGKALAETAVTNCDEAASHPDDPLRKAPGVSIDDVSGFAVIGCSILVGLHPEEPRFRYLLGRVNWALEGYEEAVRQYRMAIEGGYPMAVHAMGLAYYKGQGVEKNNAMSRKMMIRAAELGLVIAMRDAGQLLAKGVGGPKEPEAAFAYYQKAAEAGDTKSKKYLAALEAANPGVRAAAKNSSAKQEVVREIQSSLNRLGYNAGSIDGVMGRKTRTAIEAFQRDVGMTIDGLPHPDLLDHLQQTAEVQVRAQRRPAAVPAPAPAPALPQVDSNLVTSIQALLGQLGYDAGAPNGVMSPKTKSAIIAYQAVEGMIPDGLPGTPLAG